MKYVIILSTNLDSFALSLRSPLYGAAINPVIVSIAIQINKPIIAECMFCVNENIAPPIEYAAFDEDHVTLYIFYAAIPLTCQQCLCNCAKVSPRNLNDVVVKLNGTKRCTPTSADVLGESNGASVTRIV